MRTEVMQVTNPNFHENPLEIRKTQLKMTFYIPDESIAEVGCQ